MDIQIFDASSLRIKSKKTTLAFDPQKSIAKFDADAIVLTGKDNDPSRINNSRLVISGPGDYEVSGLKISGKGSLEEMIFELSSENTNILVAKTSILNNLPSDKIGDYSIVILNADEDLNQSVVTAMEPRIVILYGEKAKDGAKILGSENSSPVSKISVSEDKLPEELEVAILA